MKLMKKNTIKMLQRTFPNVSLKESVHSQEMLVPHQTPMPIFSFFFFNFLKIFLVPLNFEVFYKTESMPCQ